MPKNKSKKKQITRPKRFSPWYFLWVLVTLIIAWSATSFETAFHPFHLPSDGEPIAIYSTQNRDNLRKIYLDLLDHAQESIVFYIYTLTDQQIIQKLNTKAAQGVKVKIICDKEKFPVTKEQLSKKIKLTCRESDGLMHLKILIVDNKNILLGSTNMTTESLTVYPNNVCAIHSPNLAAYLLQIGDILQKPYKLLGESIDEKSFEIGGQQIEMWILSGNPRAHKKMVQLIDSAKKTVQVAMYTYTRYDLTHALLRAQKRGVKVEVAMDASAAKGANNHIATLLFLQNVPLYISKGTPLLHHKCMLIDDEIFITGSANWTKKAFAQNDDCFLIIHSLNAEQQDSLHTLWTELLNDCRKYDPQFELQDAA